MDFDRACSHQQTPVNERSLADYTLSGLFRHGDVMKSHFIDFDHHSMYKIRWSQYDRDQFLVSDRQRSIPANPTRCCSSCGPTSPVT